MPTEDRVGRPAFEGPVGFDLDKEGRPATAVVRSMHQALGRLVEALSGRLSLGDGVHAAWSGRVDGQWLRARTPTTPNTTFSIPHGLGRTPVGFVVYGKSAAVDVYNAPTRDHDDSQLWVRGTVGDVDILLHVV